MNRKTEWVLSDPVFQLCVGIALALWFGATVLLPTYTLDSLVNDLQGEGAVVQAPLDDGPEGNWFSVAPRRILVNGEKILVYEFPDNLQAFTVTLTLGEGGSAIFPLAGSKEVFVEWAFPSWYRKGQLIVLYGGSKASIQKVLEKHLGRAVRWN